MIRVSKTWSDVSVYLLLINLISIMVLGIFVISLKSLMLKVYKSLKELGT